jgi:hypothetical protein
MSYYDATGLTPLQRDELIVAMRRRGFTYRVIARRVGMSPGGVLRALQRIGEGRAPAAREAPQGGTRAHTVPTF